MNPFEKILDRLEENAVCEDDGTCNYCQRTWCPINLVERDEVEKIVQEVAEEYNNGWIPCSGCKDCKNKECEHNGKV